MVPVAFRRASGPGQQTKGAGFGLVALACLELVATSRAASPEAVVVRSQSGQFIVRGLPMGAPVSGYSTSAVAYLRLDPTLTAVSLERIRHVVLTELGLPDKWRGLIRVTTHPVKEDDLSVRITSVHYEDGWGYSVALPERIDKERFVNVAVEVILLEIANRAAGAHEAELPPWLAEGLSAELQATSLTTIALEPETRVLQRDHNTDVMRRARQILRRHPALKFDDLCMPSPEQRSGDNDELYRACAHLFVHELLRLRNGRDCLRDMMARLRENLNWQTTFLRSFARYFPRPIDVDKWYALNAAHLSGRDPLSLMPAEATWRQLEQILATQVQVRLTTNDLPINTTAPLQRIITEWDFAQHQAVLFEKVNQLQALRMRAPQPIAELVDAYARALQSYAGSRPAKPPKKAGPPRMAPAAKTVLQQLDELDARRKAMREQNDADATGP
jgi:hypothetical protein